MKKKDKKFEKQESKENNNKKSLILNKSNKIKSNNTRNDLPDIINLVGKSTSELPHNYDSNTYKNVKLKEKFMKILLQKGKKKKIKDKNGKILFLGRIKNNSNKENNSLINSINNKKNVKDLVQSYNIPSMRNYSKENKNSKNCIMYKTITFRENSIAKRIKSLDNKNKNKFDIELFRNEDSFFNFNGNRNRGTISFNNFILNKSSDFGNKIENKEFNVYNKRKSSFGCQKHPCIDKEVNFNLRKNKNLKMKNNFRYGQRNKSFNGNLFLTSLDKTKKENKIFLKSYEIPQNKKIIKIILDQNESQKNKAEKKLNEIPKIENKKEKNDKSKEIINKNILSEIQNKENETKKISVFNEIMDEVKEEKNYVQKIVHMKLIQGIKLLKENSHRQINLNYDSKLYGNSERQKEKNIQIIEKSNNEKYENNIDDINSTILSNKTEQNLNNTKTSDSFKNYGGNCFMKIKRIKLDKLKGKLKKDSFSFHQRNNNNNKNINISLSLNNKIININNTQKIYAPKKPSKSKKRSIQLSGIPFCPKKTDKNKFKYNIMRNINTTRPILYKKPYEENFKNIYQTTFSKNMINLNESSINDSKKNGNESKTEINPNTYNNYLEKDKINIQQMLYNKAKITKNIKKISCKNFNTSRNKAIKLFKKNKSESKRKEDTLEKEKGKNININKIIKTQEIQLGILNKKTSRKSLNNNIFEKTEPINFNLNEPIKRNYKQNNFISNKTFLSQDMNNIIDIQNNDISNKNVFSMSQFYSNNDEESTINKGTYKFGYNFSYDYDKISNNNIDISNGDMKFNYLKEELSGVSQIFYLLDFEDLLIIEDKLNLILIVLEKGNQTFEEYFDFINYFFSSNIKNKLEQIFKYFKNEAELIKIFVNYSLIFILICYDFAQNSVNITIDNNFNLIEIFQLIYTNILLVINTIKNKIELENKDNYKIRLIELSKIGYIIKDKISILDGDINLIKEIFCNNTNLITKKIVNIINNIKMPNNKFSDSIFQDIKITTFTKIYDFFLEKILKEDFIGCSVLAYSYLKQKNNFVPPREPYLKENNKKNYSLVLDLDETLIHFKLNANEKGEGILKLRPGIFTFLDKISEYYEIILFTEASEDYIKLMLMAFKNEKNRQYFNFILNRKYTLIEGNDFIKDLNRLGRPLNKTIIIDNLQKNFSRQKNNGILIKPFLGEDKNDTALIDLIPILINIAKDGIDTRNGLTKYRDEILTKISSNLFRRGKKFH